jgi:hypothetical protein
VEIVHRVAIHVDPTVIDELRALGIDPNVDEILAWFDVAESAPNWPDIERWIRGRRPSDIASTRFTAAEIAAARWLVPSATQEQGFPQPREDEFGYREVTYDTSDYCSACGVGLRQKAPFQMKGDPNMGRRGLLQMHWVYDELFAAPAVWKSIFKPFGVAARPVTKPSGTVLQKVVQLVNDERVPVDVAGLGPARGDRLVCTVCGRTKYGSVVRGPQPVPLVEPRGHLARSAEWFGSGASASNIVLLSGDLAAALGDAGVRGVSLEPATRRSASEATDLPQAAD